MRSPGKTCRRTGRWIDSNDAPKPAEGEPGSGTDQPEVRQSFEWNGGTMKTRGFNTRRQPALLVLAGFSVIGVCLVSTAYLRVTVDHSEWIDPYGYLVALAIVAFMWRNRRREDSGRRDVGEIGRGGGDMDLRRAIELDQLEPFFQPIVELESGRVRAFEALARWIKPSGEMVYPDEFIPLAEEQGIIPELTYRLLRKSCAIAAAWPEGVLLSFNISPSLLRDTGFAKQIMEIVESSGIRPNRVELEITETCAIDDEATAAAGLRELVAAGMTIAIDDFGVGHSNLARLARFRFDKIKLDRSFVSSSHGCGEQDEIIRAIVNLGLGINAQTTAEGIETPEQLERFKHFGCVYGQGYLFGKAVPAAKATMLLAQQGSRGRVRAAQAIV